MIPYLPHYGAQKREGGYMISLGVICVYECMCVCMYMQECVYVCVCVCTETFFSQFN